MIAFSEARKLLKKTWFRLPEVSRSLKEARLHVLAEDVVAPVDLPPFTNAAMDGVAVAFPPGQRVLPAGTTVRVVGEVRAGEVFRKPIGALEGVWIFTGAPVPEGVHAVAMREILDVGDGWVRLRKAVRRGEHIRPRGAEVQKGARVLRSGTLLTPLELGGLASLGIREVRVFRKPRVALLTTGDEVVEPGRPLDPGKVYNVHSTSLPLAMEGWVEEVAHRHLPDTREAVERALEDALTWADVVVFAGGISAGDYDFARDVLDARMERVFYKVAQKPGKPLYLGKARNTLVFGLPGNPSSAMVTFLVYVYPTLRALAGHPRPDLEAVRLPLVKEFRKKPDRTWLVWARETAKGLRVFPEQASHRLVSFGGATHLALLPARRVRFREGEMVQAFRLPFA